MNCSQVAMFQIMPALCPHGYGGGGGQPNVDRSGQREGIEVPKILKFVRISFMNDLHGIFMMDGTAFGTSIANSSAVFIVILFDFTNPKTTLLIVSPTPTMEIF